MHPVARLLEMVPEYAERYPLTIVVDHFADHVREHPDPAAFEAIEALAASGDERVRNAVAVSFLEAFDWDEDRLGPETSKLAHEA